MKQNGHREGRRGRPCKELKTYPNSARRLRKEKGLTATECAEKTDVVLSCLCRYEKTGIGIGTRSRYRLAEFFGVTPQELDTPS